MIKEYLQKWLNIKKEFYQADAVIEYGINNSVFDMNEAIRAFSNNVWVNSCVSLRAEVFANANFYLEDKEGVRIDKHPLLDLLKQPNEYITRFNIMQLVSMHLDLCGNAYWKYDFSGNNFKGQIVRIQPLLPQYVTVKVSSEKFVESFKYMINGQTKIFQPEEITHFMAPSPLSLVEGTAPIQSAAFAIDTEEQSNSWNYNFFKNGATVGAILEHDNTLAKEVKDRIKKAFDAAHSGDKKAFRSMVLDGGLRLKEIKTSQRDMEFSQLQITNRDKVIGVYRVPKILLAQYEGGSLAEAETAQNIFAKYTMTPRLQSFVETLNLDLLPIFGIKDQSLQLKFDSIIEDDKQFQLQKDDNALNKWMTINERREMEGYEPIEGGEELYQTISNVPLSYVNEPVESVPPQTPPTEAKEIDFVNRKKEKRVKILLKRYGTQFKNEYEKKFLSNHGRQEMRFIKKLKKVFADQKREVLDNLRKNKSYKITKSLADDIFNADKQEKLFIKAFSPLIEEIAKENSREVNTFFGLGVDRIEDLPSFQATLKKQVFKFAQEVNETTKNKIRAELAEGLGAGEGVDKLAERMQGIFKNASVSRSQTIARTETTKASATGALTTYEESGVVKGKEWLTTMDDRTRMDHAEANGQTRKLDEKFSVNGEEMDAPGLGNIAENNINCRCTIIPVIM
jgi:HK97 family phage portal protein